MEAWIGVPIKLLICEWDKTVARRDSILDVHAPPRQAGCSVVVCRIELSVDLHLELLRIIHLLIIIVLVVSIIAA